MQPQPSLEALTSGRFPTDEIDPYVNGRKIPSHLFRAGLTSSAWLDLPPADRVERLNFGLANLDQPFKRRLIYRAKIEAAAAEAAAAKAATEPVVEEPVDQVDADEIDDEIDRLAVQSRRLGYRVLCVGDCGRWLDASSGKPSSRRCKECAKKHEQRERMRIAEARRKRARAERRAA